MKAFILILVIQTFEGATSQKITFNNSQECENTAIIYNGKKVDRGTWYLASCIAVEEPKQDAKP